MNDSVTPSTDPNQVLPPAGDALVIPTDPAASANPTSTPATTPEDPQKDPLALLEELLGEQKAAAVTGATADTAPSAQPAGEAPAAPPEATGPTEAEIDEMEALQAAEDKVAAEAKLAEIHAETAAQAAHAVPTEAAPVDDGFQINQIGHTKI